MNIDSKMVVALGIMIAGNSWTQAETSAGATLSKAEQATLFKAAGAVQRKGKWVICADDPQARGAQIETVHDLNGDGRPEALITEGGSFCYGATEAGFTLLSKQADDRWRVMATSTGMAEFLKTRGADNWPDISVGGPGFCFPVLRWNGKEYKLQRFEYEGKRCKQPR